MWDELRYSTIDYIEEKYFISTKISMIDCFQWWLSAIYDPVKWKDNRKLFWDEWFVVLFGFSVVTSM